MEASQRASGETARSKVREGIRKMEKEQEEGGQAMASS